MTQPTDPAGAPDPSSPLDPPALASKGDVQRTVTEMKKLLAELEQSGKERPPAALSTALELNARILQYVHDSHLKLAQTLENKDRTEMVVQSTAALNRTFKKLHESQESLVERLAAERRKSPVLVMVACAFTGALMLIGLFFLVDGLNGGLHKEVAAMSAARDGMQASFAESQQSFDKMGTQLAGTLDKVLAANRVLDNELRAKSGEIDHLKGEVESLRGGFDGAKKAQDDAAARAAAEQDKNAKLTQQVDEMRDKLVAQELAKTKLDELIAKIGDASKSPAPAVTAPPASSDPPAPSSTATDAPAEADPVAPNAPNAPDAPDAPATQPDASAPPPVATEPAPKAPEPTPPSALPFDPVTRAFNEFLSAAGVIDTRMLRHGEAGEGELKDVVLEVRSAEGLPIGFRSARYLKLEVDPGVRSAVIDLKDGETVIRGARTPFENGALRIEIGAVAPQSWTVTELLGFLKLKPAPAGDGEARRPAPPPFDATVPLLRINGALKKDSRGRYELFGLAGIERGELLGPRLHHYGPGGVLKATTEAARCRVALDAARGKVTLVFLEGQHATDAGQVPFFRGKADDVSSWSLELEDADISRWSAIVEFLAAPGGPQDPPAAPGQG